MKSQMKHLGSRVMPEFISVSDNNPLKKDITEKILKQFINLM